VPRLNPVHLVRSHIPEPGPRRPYALATLVNTFGSGLMLVALPLYVNRFVGLSAGQIGLGLTIALTITLLWGLPIGDMADRRGPLKVVKAGLLLQFAATVAFVFINNFTTFVIVATVNTLAARAIMSSEGALLRRLAGEEAAGYRSLVYAITNIGFSAGVAFSSISIQIDTRTAYHALILINALTFVAAWAILRTLPHYEPLPKPKREPRWGVLRDRAFVAFSVLAAILALQFYVLTLLLPLWVINYTDAPRWCIPLSLFVNTIMVVLVQVRIGSRIKTIIDGGFAWRRAGVFFLLSCAAIGFAAGMPAWAALLLVVAGVVLHTFGEIFHIAGGFALGLGLPPAHAQGQYDGFLSIIGGIGAAAAPVLLLGPVMSFGKAGMVTLGVVLVLTGLLMPAVARWGERTRPAKSDDSEADVETTKDSAASE
jgi:MFS family permease